MHSDVELLKVQTVNKKVTSETSEVLRNRVFFFQKFLNSQVIWRICYLDIMLVLVELCINVLFKSIFLAQKLERKVQLAHNTSEIGQKYIGTLIVNKIYQKNQIF